MVTLPPGWEKDFVSDTSAVFRNDQFDLQVEINPRFASSTRHTRTQNRSPDSYCTQIVQDWFSKGVHGDVEVGNQVDSWEDAVAVAETFMHQFNAERGSHNPDHINAVHQSAPSRDGAETLLNTTAAAEALTDGAGYSDTVFLELIEAGTANRHQFVAHRDAADVDILYNQREREFSEQWVHELCAAFPVDKVAVDEVVGETTPLTMMVHLSTATLYRFLFAPGQETHVVVQKNTSVDSPTFEQTIEGVLTEKWA